MSLVDELLKRVQRVRGQPILPILRREQQRKIYTVPNPPEGADGYQVSYKPPLRKTRRE